MLLKNYPQSEKLNSVSMNAELLYCRLLALCDDRGNYYGEPGLIAVYALGHRLANMQITIEQVSGLIDELEHVDLIRHYENGHNLHVQKCHKYLRDDVKRDERFSKEPDDFGGIVNVRESDGTEFRAEPVTEPLRNRYSKGSEGNVKEKKGKKERPQPSADGLALARELRNRVFENFPTSASISKLSGSELEKRLNVWAGEIDRIMRLDERTADELRAVINFAHNDNVPRNGFCWAAQLHSPKNLRNDSLWTQFHANGGKQHGRQSYSSDLPESQA